MGCSGRRKRGSSREHLSRRTSVGLFAVAIAMGSSPGRSEPVPPAYDEALVQAEMVERFCRFIDWPAAALGGLDQPFVVGLVGDDAVGRRIEDIALARRIQGRRVEVRRLARLVTASSCHLVWVGKADPERVAEVLTFTRARPILTVGSAPGLAEAGTLINIVPRGDRMGFEVNLGEVESSGLEFSSKLLRLARIVGARPKRTP